MAAVGRARRARRAPVAPDRPIIHLLVRRQKALTFKVGLIPMTDLRRLCAGLRQRLAGSQATQSRLADALVESALSA